MAKSIKVSNINNRVDDAKHMHVIMNVKRTVDNVMGVKRTGLRRTSAQTLTSMRTALSGIFEELLWRLNYGEYNFKTSY